MKGEREISTSAVRSLWCHGMLMNIIYVVSSMSNECKCIVVLLEYFAGASKCLRVEL